MSKKSDRNSNRSPAPNGQPIIPDPWETIEPETHFPSPLELDRLLREPHPLIQATEPYPEISPAGQPGVGLLTPMHLAEVRPERVLLQNELKLHTQWIDHLNFQVEKALALLYWLAIASEQTLA
jgi:hypothetical protein